MSAGGQTARLNRSAAYAGIGVALLLVLLKSWAAWSTGSTAMLGSLADTVLDLIASLVCASLTEGVVFTGESLAHTLLMLSHPLPGPALSHWT